MFKSIDSKIMEKSLSPKMFLFFAFISMGSFIKLPSFSKFTVEVSTKKILDQIELLNIVIPIIFFILIYKIIKTKDLGFFAYCLIPLYGLFRIITSLFFVLPLTYLNVAIIKNLDLDFGTWNAINSMIISIIINIVFYVFLYTRIKKIYMKIEESQSSKTADNSK